MGIDIENEVFQRTTPDFSKFIPYGFLKMQNKYHLEMGFMDRAFRAIINIDSNKAVIYPLSLRLNSQIEFVNGFMNFTVTDQIFRGT